MGKNDLPDKTLQLNGLKRGGGDLLLLTLLFDVMALPLSRWLTPNDLETPFPSNECILAMATIIFWWIEFEIESNFLEQLLPISASFLMAWRVDSLAFWINRRFVCWRMFLERTWRFGCLVGRRWWDVGKEEVSNHRRFELHGLCFSVMLLVRLSTVFSAPNDGL